MIGWDKKEIITQKSRGGVMAVCNYEDNLIIPTNCIWPHPDIVKKIYRSVHENAYGKEELDKLSKKLGFYCDLQSLSSEDAITWSVFGTLNYFSKAEQVKYINSLLEKIAIEERISDECWIQLWCKIAHPDTLVPGGPELDLIIVSENIVIFGEAKWRSKVAVNQGIGKNQSQIQLRNKYLHKYGKIIFPNAKTKIVLLVDDDTTEIVADKIDNDVIEGHISWEATITDEHPMKKELNEYYKWKTRESK
jgi:hypothetical protein